MIKVIDLTKKYGIKEVVSHISMEVSSGDVLGFIGPNGAGKSTTIKMISGVLPVYDGRILINGIDISKSPREAKNRIGYLPENAPLPPNMTVHAFLKYVAAMRGIPARKRKSAILDAVRNCALEEVLDQEIEALSKGYKRRVCFAQAIIHKPQVLLLDEPTDGLDPNQKREIRNLIQTLRKNTAIVISTHILEEVRSVCTNVLLLSQGKIAFQGKTADFTEMENKLRCCALTFPPEQIHTAAELLQEKFPGSCRLDGDKIILPDDIAIAQSLPGILQTANLAMPEPLPCATSLDDVFAYLTRQSDLSDPPAQDAAKPSKQKETTAPAVEGECDDD